MNILFINCQFRLFDGIDCGASNRSNAFLQSLTLLGHVDVISFYKEKLISNTKDCDVIYSDYIGLATLQPSNMFSKIIRKLREYICVSSPSSYYKLSVERETVVDSFVRKTNYDFIACRYLDDAITCGLLKYSHKLVIDIDDNPVTALKRQLFITEFPNPWSRYTTRYKAEMIGIMAKKVLRKVRCSFFSNPNEPPFRKSIFLHNVTSRPSCFTPITSSTPMRLLIVGWLDYWPNKLGTLYFAEKIFPRIKEIVPSVELHVAGKTTDHSVIDKLNSYEGVSALGYVQDINYEYTNARVVIVPIYHGAGTSVKFIEGISMGKAVVSTTMGVRGFDMFCQNGKDYLEAKSDGDFIALTIKLLTSIDLANEMAQNGYTTAKNNFSIERFQQIVKDSILNGHNL